MSKLPPSSPDGSGKPSSAQYAMTHDSSGEVMNLTPFEDDSERDYQIGNNPDHSSHKMMADYQLRWTISVFFEDSTRRLGV